jgi:hypothetical protein
MGSSRCEKFHAIRARKQYHYPLINFGRAACGVLVHMQQWLGDTKVQQKLDHISKNARCYRIHYKLVSTGQRHIYTFGTGLRC